MPANAPAGACLQLRCPVALVGQLRQQVRPMHSCQAPQTHRQCSASLPLQRRLHSSPQILRNHGSLVFSSKCIVIWGNCISHAILLPRVHLRHLAYGQLSACIGMASMYSAVTSPRTCPLYSNLNAIMVPKAMTRLKLIRKYFSPAGDLSFGNSLLLIAEKSSRRIASIRQSDSHELNPIMNELEGNSGVGLTEILEWWPLCPLVAIDVCPELDLHIFQGVVQAKVPVKWERHSFRIVELFALY